MAEPRGTSAESRRDLTTIVRRRSPWITLLLAELAAVVLGGTLVVGLYSSKIAATPEGFDLLSHRSWSLIGFAIVIGAASAATVQMLKQFLPVRAALQRRWVMEWIGDRCAVEALWADWLERQKIPKDDSSAKGHFSRTEHRSGRGTGDRPAGRLRPAGLAARLRPGR
jgi:hypothetical protein